MKSNRLPQVASTAFFLISETARICSAFDSGEKGYKLSEQFFLNVPSLHSILDNVIKIHYNFALSKIFFSML